LAGIEDDDPVFLAGSTKAGEEAAVIAAYTDALREHPRLRLAIAPRNAARFDEVARLLDKSGLAWQRRTELDGASAASEARVLLVDTVGELAAWWHLADIAFVGGSLFSGGGQNMIEPAACGAAIAFGSHTHNFSDVVSLLLHNEAAVVVESPAALSEFVRRCLNEPEFARLLGWRARQVVQKQSGAVQATMRQLTPQLAALLGDAKTSAARYQPAGRKSRAA
jgi:3-deoxy-D-manno-octulosonic-acid transferase